MRLPTLTEEFAEYVNRCYAGVAISDVQYAETKQTFMAGALVALQAGVRACEDDISEAEAMTWLSSLMDECITYHHDRIQERTREN